MAFTPNTTVAYVHFQQFERDGSHTHTSNFIREFGHIAERDKFQFIVRAPALISGVPGEVSRISQFKSYIARFYVSDIKNLLKQLKQFLTDVKYLKRHNISIVLTRYNYNTISIVWACRYLNIPVVLEINAPDSEQQEATFYRIPWIRQLFNVDNVSKTVNGLFAVSGFLRDHFQHQKGAVDIPMHAIQNGVNLADFSQFDTNHKHKAKQRLGLEQHTTIGFVGSFAPWHRVDLLIDAFTNIAESYPDAALLLVGEVRQDTRDTILSSIPTSLKSRIHFTGFVKKEDVSQYLAAMDIATLPNTEDYCSPLKLFEYMAMALPTLCVSTAAVNEVIHDGKEGICFERGDVASMQAGLCTLLSDPALRESLGNNAATRVKSTFTWENNATRVYNLLQEVLDD